MTAVTAEKSSCIFCNIVNKLENTEILYEDDDVSVFRDIKPASKFHVLIVPKRHIDDAKCLTPADKELVKANDKIIFVFTCITSKVKGASGQNSRLLPNHNMLCSCDELGFEVPERVLVTKMQTTAHELLGKNNLSSEDARLGYHWPPFRSVKHLHLHAIAPESEMGFISRLIFKKGSYWFVSPDYVASLL